MVTVNQRPITTEDTRRSAGLLGQQVKQDMEDVLNDFGAPAAESQPEQTIRKPSMTFGYGIPMAGVRYYSFTSEA